MKTKIVMEMCLFSNYVKIKFRYFYYSTTNDVKLGLSICIVLLTSQFNLGIFESKWDVQDS